jgi:MFS family permease
MGGPLRLFYGWWIVVVAGIGLCFGCAPIIVYSTSVFIKPLAQELHSNRASISFAFTLANLMASISSPLTGRLADRFSARRVILIASGIFCVVTDFRSPAFGQTLELLRFLWPARICGEWGCANTLRQSHAHPKTASEIQDLRQ